MIQNSGRAVVVILGSTGTGKSKLAIEIAKKFCGEIISADSMQVYKGLDIITNKVKLNEQHDIPHHMLDCVDPVCQYTVSDFKTNAVPIINNLLDDKKLPVIVGGTNYYIESLLWKILVQNKVETDEDDEGDEDVRETTNRSYSSLNNTELHNKLNSLDPVMATRLHPCDRRKVLRSIEVFEQLGKPHSDFIAEQKLMDGGNSFGAPLRFKNSCIIWVNADKTVLNERLDKRVDDMVNDGLLSELSSFHKTLSKKGADECNNADYTHGILQSIGFKEFHDYLMMTKDEIKNDTEKLNYNINEGIERLKLVTRRYARKQIKWIRNRFLRKPDREVPNVYQVDSSDILKWEDNVFNPASEVVSSYMKSEVPEFPTVPVETDAPQYEQTTYFCVSCDKIILGELQWIIHLKSRRHKKILNSINKNAEKENEKDSNTSEN